MREVYIIDTSAFIDAKSYYPPESFGSFWKAIEDMTRNGEVIIISKVAEELKKGNDYLADEFLNNISVEDSEKMEYIRSIRELMKEVDPSSVQGWKSWVKKADPWVVAVAYHIKLSTLDDPIVLHNKVERGNQLKIETECRKLGIKNDRIHRLIKDKRIRFEIK